MMLIRKLLLLSTMGPWALYAKDHQIGNGGDVVDCRSKPAMGKNISLLDFYERDAIRPDIDLALGDPGLDLNSKVHIALTRLERIDPFLAGQYLDKYNDFFDQVNWVDYDLVDIKDEGLTIVPECPLRQIVIQREPRTPDDKLYLINKELWDALPTDDQAALVLHELIYGREMAFGHMDSYLSRYFNTLLTSSRFSTMTEEVYFSLLKKIKFASLIVVEQGGRVTWRFLDRKTTYEDAESDACQGLGAGWRLARLDQLKYWFTDSSMADALLLSSNERVFWVAREQFDIPKKRIALPRLVRQEDGRRRLDTVWDHYPTNNELEVLCRFSLENP